MVSFTTAIKNGFKKAFDFSGRATRAEYWWWILFNNLLIMASSAICVLFAEIDESIAVIPIFICLIVIFIPSLAVTVRRLHDGGNSGWYLLWNLLPYIGSFIVFLATLEKSESDNKYGPNPNKKTKNEPTNSENNEVKEAKEEEVKPQYP